MYSTHRLKCKRWEGARCKFPGFQVSRFSWVFQVFPGAHLVDINVQVSSSKSSWHRFLLKLLQLRLKFKLFNFGYHSLVNVWDGRRWSCLFVGSSVFDKTNLSETVCLSSYVTMVVCLDVCRQKCLYLKLFVCLIVDKYVSTWSCLFACLSVCLQINFYLKLSVCLFVCWQK